MVPLLMSWLSLCFVFFGVPGIYFAYLRHAGSRPWGIEIDRTFAPHITIIVPAHNEEKTIELKLRNLLKLIYPKERMQVLVVNDASTDQTLRKINEFASSHSDMKIEILDEPERRGKVGGLNHALEHARNEIVIVSDADTFWTPDILVKSLPYLSDPRVAAITGNGKILNIESSSVTKGEGAYRSLVDETVRSNESKIHSTIFFSGAFSAYKREFLEDFNPEADDSGTALDIVQKGGRTLLIKEAHCFYVFSSSLRGKISTKLRRAIQLVGVWSKSLGLLTRGRLLIPHRIAVAQIYLHLVSPIVFVLLLLTTLIVVINYLPYSLVLLLVLVVPLVLPKTRILVAEFVQDYIIMLVALLSSMTGKKFSSWSTLEEPRSLLSEDALSKRGLI